MSYYKFKTFVILDIGIFLGSFMIVRCQRKMSLNERKGNLFISCPHCFYSLLFLTKNFVFEFCNGKSEKSFFPDWPLILHFKSKKPQTLKIFSLFSCTLDYSFSWDAFFLYNSSKSRRNEKLNQKSKYSDACRDRSAYSATSWFRCSCSGRLSIYRCCCDSRGSCWTPDVSQWSPVNVCHTDFVFNCHPETDLLECLVFFISTLKNDNNKRGFLGWIV